MYEKKGQSNVLRASSYEPGVQISAHHFKAAYSYEPVDRAGPAGPVAEISARH